METSSENIVDLKLSRKHPKRQGLRKTIIFTSSFLFPAIFYYLSPYVPIQGGFDGVIVGSLMVFAGMFIQSLLLGRAYCGWVCPVAGMQDAIISIKKNNRRVKARSFFVKWVIWVPWIIFVIINPFVLGSGINSVDFFHLTREKWYISLSSYNMNGDFDGSYVIYYAVIALVLILALTVGKRSFCHHVCWMAPFMIIGRWLSNFLRIPSLRMKANKDACIECHRCDKDCPMSLPVEEMVLRGKFEHRECILCGTCADVCPKGVIVYSFSSFKK